MSFNEFGVRAPVYIVESYIVVFVCPHILYCVCSAHVQSAQCRGTKSVSHTHTKTNREVGGQLVSSFSVFRLLLFALSSWASHWAWGPGGLARSLMMRSLMMKETSLFELGSR